MTRRGFPRNGWRIPGTLAQLRVRAYLDLTQGQDPLARTTCLGPSCLFLRFSQAAPCLAAIRAPGRP
jgi:hypothetical protein